MIYQKYGRYDKLVYEGDWKRGKRHGYGHLIGSDGSEFHGNWEKGLQVYGQFSSPEGHRYIGYWKGPKIDKEGIYQDPKGKVYRGQISNGLLSGRGIMTQDDTTISGIFENNKLNRRGKIEVGDIIYEGEIKNDKPHGLGKKINDFFTYMGEWKNGLEDGKGELKFHDTEDVYTGSFKNG